MGFPICSSMITVMLLFLFILQDHAIRLVKYKKRQLGPSSAPQASKLSNVFNV